MASHTAPAAIPDPPAHPPTAGAAAQPDAPRGSLFAAVDPARPTDDDADGGFTLTPTTGRGDDDTLLMNAPGSPSSDAFHNTPTDPDSSASGSGAPGQQNNGIWRAWMLALAKRHEQAGTARLKALEIKKAQATALQVKETRTTSRSEKIVGGNTNSGTNAQSRADKSNDNKNHHTKTDSASGRGSGAGGSGRGGNSGGPGKNGPAGHGNGTTGKSDSKTDKGKTPSRKDPAGTGSESKPTGGTGKDGVSGHQGNSGKPGKDGKTNAGTGSGGAAGTSGSGKDTKPKASTDTCGTGSGIDMTKKPKDTTANGKGGPQGAPGGSGGKAPNGTGGSAGAAGKPGINTGPGKTPAPGGPQAPKTTPPASKPGIDTQKARETGYQDGTRIGNAVSQAEAYKDGVKDGYRDTREAAATEQARLDKAHQDHKQRPPTPSPAPAQTQKVPPKPTTPPASAPTAATGDKPVSLTKPDRDKQPPATKPEPAPTGPKDQPMPAPAQATPIQVRHADATQFELGDGADRQHISRGEVRNLAGHTHRLTGRRDTLNTIAERAMVYEAHAQEQTKEITDLLEQARSAKIKGGEKLVAELARLEETSKQQQAKAHETVKRAARGADACDAVSANVNVRYGGIYRAAADSADGPAELNYYRDLGYAHA